MCVCVCVSHQPQFVSTFFIKTDTFCLFRCSHFSTVRKDLTLSSVCSTERGLVFFFLSFFHHCLFLFSLFSNTHQSDHVPGSDVEGKNLAVKKPVWAESVLKKNNIKIYIRSIKHQLFGLWLPTVANVYLSPWHLESGATQRYPWCLSAAVPLFLCLPGSWHLIKQAVNHPTLQLLSVRCFYYYLEEKWPELESCPSPRFTSKSQSSVWTEESSRNNLTLVTVVQTFLYTVHTLSSPVGVTRTCDLVSRDQTVNNNSAHWNKRQWS